MFIKYHFLAAPDSPTPHRRSRKTIHPTGTDVDHDHEEKLNNYQPYVPVGRQRDILAAKTDTEKCHIPSTSVASGLYQVRLTDICFIYRARA